MTFSIKNSNLQLARSQPTCRTLHVGDRFFMFFALWMTLFPKRQDATHEPECSHVKHFCETNYLNSFVLLFPVTVPVHYRLWNVGWGGMPSVECEENGVLNGECNV